MATRRTSAPSVEPVTLAEAKVHLRVTHSSEDALITALIVAAREHVESVTGRKLISQQWELIQDAFPCGPVQLPFSPIITIDSVKYLDDDGALQTLDTAEYAKDTYSVPGWVSPVDTWPSTYDTINAVTIAFTVGYGATAADVPASLKAAMLLMIGDLFENREARSQGNAYQGNPAFDALVFPYKMLWV